MNKPNETTHAHCRCMYGITGCQKNHFGKCKICGDFDMTLPHTDTTWEERLKSWIYEGKGENVDKNATVLFTKRSILTVADICDFISAELTSLKQRQVEGVEKLPNTYEDDEEAVFRTTKAECIDIIQTTN